MPGAELERTGGTGGDVLDDGVAVAVLIGHGEQNMEGGVGQREKGRGIFVHPSIICIVDILSTGIEGAGCVRAPYYTCVFMSHYLAIDLGAESGRALLGSLSGGRLVRGGTPPLSEYAGARAGRALLGHPAALARDPARHRDRRRGSVNSPSTASASIRGASITRCSAPTDCCSTIPATIATRATTA